ncbi:unnamed protein product [Enterobius vermicularis]|uniref:LPS-assembly lipoprotein LptE n=1 Tax=Enterobius vermicularis TaxID=51028 RepID=A0A0N4VA91_ENTVE|nr:unnamed protein product [Enterobius vermicularis]
MKILFSYLWLLLPTCSAYLHIEDLRKMVLNNTQRKQLQILAKEVLRPRSVVQQEVALIANNQTEDVQRVYQLLVTIEGLQEEATYQLEMVVLRNIGASERILNLRQQMRTVELDVSLSRKQSAEVILEMKDELRRALTKANRSVLDQLGITP